MNVREIGEQGLLRRLQAFCPADVIGDDAAVFSVPDGYSLVVTTDVLIDGVHFSDRTTAPEDAGWRAAAASLSDLAAMGAEPLAITVGLGLPGAVSVDWVERLYQGMTDCLQRFATVIVGGDIVRSPVITIAITAFGKVVPGRIIRRAGARPNQAIIATGYHGAARAGLELLLHPTPTLAYKQQEFFQRAHQRPNPRLDILPLLWEHHLSELAGMDSSDGLADAVLQICRASGVGAILERSRLPIPPGLVTWVGEEQAVNWTLYGGEDFELVLCLPYAVAESLVMQLGEGAVLLGRTTVDLQVCVIDLEGEYPKQNLTLEQGFQHYQ